MRERVHHYRYCPQCKANVEPHFRFCRSCFYWLARPHEGDLRGLALHPDTQEHSLLSRFWFFENLFQTSFLRIASAFFLILVALALMVWYTSSLLPSWLLISPRLKKNACYANMRVIQTALEEYNLEHRFTPELGRHPVKVLHESGCLRNLAECPTSGNRYTIPIGSTLQCVGSEGHGIP